MDRTICQLIRSVTIQEQMENLNSWNIPTMAQMLTNNKVPEYLFWVGSAGSYDDRAKKITLAFAKILVHCNINFAILGSEETDTGDSARRAGNEFLFQMQSIQNIEIFNNYQVKKILTCCPHDYNTLKNEYPDLGGNYEVYHHTEFIFKLLKEKRLKIDQNVLVKKKITYHDPCYLGRGNGIIDAPRFVLNSLNPRLTEMKRSKNKSLCCGAGGSQMFKEAEKGNMEVYELRTNDILEVNPDIVATACPFCMTMLTDGIKMKEKQNEIKVQDIAELISQCLCN